MRPRRYPYRGEKESTFVKADPELVLNINKIKYWKYTSEKYIWKNFR